MTRPNYDIIVIGAGVAGGVYAASQPKDKNVLVIERDLSEQERIIGELMQPGGVESLKKLNLGHLLDGFDARKVGGYKLIKGTDSFTIHYTEVDANITGVGLRNGKFLSRIREELKSRSNVELIQGNVTELIEKDGRICGVKFVNSEGESLSNIADLTVVSDGPMSFFRKKLSEPNKKIASYFMGLVLKDLTLQNPELGHMIVTGDYPILVYPIHSNGYRILIDYPGDKPPRMGGKSIQKIREEVGALLPAEMVDSFHHAIDTDQMQVMPNHSMKAQVYRKEGVVMLGDSLNMRHPLTGGGMTASFEDIISLNTALKGIDLSDTSKLNLAIQSYYQNRSKSVETINILANALYKVFRDDEMKEAVFEYLQKGGEKSTGPLSILAGINKSKKYLLKHFFNVALQHPFRFIIKPRKQIRLYRTALGIIRPILKEEEQAAIL